MHERRCEREIRLGLGTRHGIENATVAQKRSRYVPRNLHVGEVEKASTRGSGGFSQGIVNKGGNPNASRRTHQTCSNAIEDRAEPADGAGR